MFNPKHPGSLLRALPLLALAVASTSALAQSSASYSMDEHVLNSGGNAAASASFSLSFVAFGESTAGAVAPSSASFSVDVGFTTTNPPPGEVVGLTFLDHASLTWDVERSAGTYNLYRDGLGALSGSGYGSCTQQGLSDNGATDATTPSAGDGFFYLVTVRNRLYEEGTKGSASSGSERTGETCP